MARLEVYWLLSCSASVLDVKMHVFIEYFKCILVLLVLYHKAAQPPKRHLMQFGLLCLVIMSQLNVFKIWLMIWG